jgi:MFS family permease
MMGIATVLMASTRYDSYTIAGTLSATNSVAWAIGAAVLASLVDRFGQRRVMLPASVLSGALLLLVVVLAATGAPAWTLFAPTALSGFTAGAPGALVRARWNYVLADPQQLHAALSLESTLDEGTWVFGPMIATLLATMLFPEAGLIGVVAVGVSGSLAFYAQRRTEPPSHPTRAPKQSGGGLLLAVPGVFPVILVNLLVGMAFGAADVSIVAAAEHFGNKGWSGIVLGVIALGSASAGLAYGSRKWRSPIRHRFAVFTLFYAATTWLLVTSPSIWALGAFGLLNGFAIAPSFINSNSLIQQIVPEHRLTEGLSWIGTSVGIGGSLGSTAAGYFIDQTGAFVGLTTAAIGASLAALIAAATLPLLARAQTPRSIRSPSL